MPDSCRCDAHLLNSTHLPQQHPPDVISLLIQNHVRCIQARPQRLLAWHGHHLAPPVMTIHSRSQGGQIWAATLLLRLLGGSICRYRCTADASAARRRHARAFGHGRCRSVHRKARHCPCQRTRAVNAAAPARADNQVQLRQEHALVVAACDRHGHTEVGLRADVRHRIRSWG
eukprot:363291-Chlamydomonas_euryale.AAC.28